MITVFGASDDLIEVDGDIREEFYHRDENEGDLLAFSDGSVLRIHYTAAGVWRITPVIVGSSVIHIAQAPEDDANNYSDKATLSGPDITWVAHAVAFAKRS